jgi:hypothetical protein
MSEKLTGKRENNPVVGVIRKLNGYFVGKLLDTGREVKMRKGKGHVYSFNIEDTDFSTQIKDKDGKYVEANVTPGMKVSIFAPTVLHGALQQAKIGDRIKLIYLGKAQGERSDYHNFDVERLDPK